MIEMVESELDGARLTASDLLGIGLMGDGTGSVTSTKALDGLLAAVDDGTNYATYLGLSRTGGDAIATALTTFDQAPGSNFVNTIVDLSALPDLMGNVEFRVAQIGTAAANGGSTSNRN